MPPRGCNRMPRRQWDNCSFLETLVLETFSVTIAASVAVLLLLPQVAGQYNDCASEYLDFIGNGVCDYENNNADCGYDGGDCCPSTCFSSSYGYGLCSSYAGFCFDPLASDYTPLYENCTGTGSNTRKTRTSGRTQQGYMGYIGPHGTAQAARRDEVLIPLLEHKLSCRFSCVPCRRHYCWCQRNENKIVSKYDTPLTILTNVFVALILLPLVHRTPIRLGSVVARSHT